MVVCLVFGALVLLIWVSIALHPARPWDFRPAGEDSVSSLEPYQWPSVQVLIPARNEAAILLETLPSLLHQDYPGPFSVSVIDDRSQDQTASAAAAIAEQCKTRDRLRVVSGAALPSGWVGKVWALQQGAVACGFEQDSNEGLPDYLLLTDADIWHAPDSLRCLVTESEAEQLALNSRMARLRCASFAERLLIPPFVFFFILLYPLRWVNDPRKKTAASAGGCVLLSSQALIRIGGFRALRDQLIDDVTLGRLVKGVGLTIRLSLSRTDVKSLRIYDTVDSIWSMVRRTAFTQLKYSWLRLIGTVVGMAVAFSLPPLFFLCGLVFFGLHLIVDIGVSAQLALLLMLEGGIAWGLMTTVYLPGVRFFDLRRVWGFSLPLAAILYEAMTLDSAFRHLRKKRVDWR
ncbi:MAG: glycosyltransferase [Desulfurellaceae bacterium]|nr:glycosyltransferase [Desulfurellaceae bacterium]